MVDSIRDWLRISYGVFLHLGAGIALLTSGLFLYMAVLYLLWK
jgi:hypothetical protein